MSIELRAAAADIAVALTIEADVTAKRVEEIGMAAGHTRSATRAGLAWAVEHGLIRRRYGARTARFYHLATGPEQVRYVRNDPAVRFANGDPQGVSGQ